jgi:diguanylate cyclase (GGDEF)-like protein
VSALIAPEHEVEGCYLLTNREVGARTENRAPGYASKLNGRGPHAWNHHSLIVPLHDRDGSLVGVIWVDEPEDRLLPSRERLQSLRMFANQASAALESVAQLEELRFLADHDPLTRLENRRAFIRRLGEETARADRYRSCFALVVCDLDGFKDINDRHGHMAGDHALQRVADVLRDSIRATDGAYRLGGDEFGLILIAADREDALATAGRIGEGLRAAAEGESHLSELRLSFGAAVYPREEGSPEGLFHAADAAMYEAKRAGGVSGGTPRVAPGVMTSKSDFNAEEWELLARAPALAALTVAMADRGGSFKESFSLARAYQEAREHATTELLEQLVSTAPTLDPRRFQGPDQVRSDAEQSLREAIALISQKATPEEAEAYKRFTMSVADTVAHAHKEGGFLGIGGKEVSPEEQAVLGELSQIVG